MAGNRTRQEISDEVFFNFLIKAKELYNGLYEYSDFKGTSYPLTVRNTKTGKCYKQRINHILDGKLPSEEKRRKYTKDNCQMYSDQVFNRKI